MWVRIPTVSAITPIFSSPSTYPLSRVLLYLSLAPGHWDASLERLWWSVEWPTYNARDIVDPPVASEGVWAGGEQLSFPQSLQPTMPASSPEYHILSVSHVSWKMLTNLSTGSCCNWGPASLLVCNSPTVEHHFKGKDTEAQGDYRTSSSSWKKITAEPECKPSGPASWSSALS